MKEKYLSSVLLSILVCSASVALGTAKNESDIKVEDIAKTSNDIVRKLDQAGNPVPGTSIVQWCRGAVSGDVDLSKANLSADDLKQGLSCVVDDFDGNGYLDFLIYQKSPANDGKWHPRSALVLFFKGHSVKKSQVIGSFEVFQSTDSERINYPKYRTRAGLIRHAQGDTGMVYFYQPKSGLFEELPYVYPKDYEMGE